MQSEQSQSFTALVRQAKVTEALALYGQAVDLETKTNAQVGADAWNRLCWQGALAKAATDVLDACNRAIQSAPENGGYRDSRGIALAQLGELDRAKEDFDSYVDWAPSNNRMDSEIQRRVEWVRALSDGRNPIDEQTLKALGGGS